MAWAGAVSLAVYDADQAISKVYWKLSNVAGEAMEIQPSQVPSEAADLIRPWR
jgi:hypothetical protein